MILESSMREFSIPSGFLQTKANSLFDLIPVQEIIRDITISLIITIHISIENYVHFLDEIKMTYDVFTSEKLSYRPFDWSEDFSP